VNNGSLGRGRIVAARRTVGIALALVSGAWLLFASAAQASGRRADLPASRWGGFTTRAPRVGDARHDRRAAAEPAAAGTASIEGTVTDAVKSTGIAGIEVCALAVGPFEEEAGEEVGEEGGGCALTTAGGDYTITGLAAGEYIVAFSTPFDGTLDYITQYYKEAKTFGKSTAIDLVAGEHRSNIDAALSKGGEVEGHVTKAAGGALTGIEVCAFGSEAVACATTNFGGTYRITGLPTGSFKVGFRATPSSGLNYITQFYNNKTSYTSADPIAVKAEAKNEGIDAAMATGAEIEGAVTSGETGAPSSETLVCAHGEGENEEPGSCAETDSSGGYVIAGLPSGSYTVVFFADAPPEYYHQVFSESEATPVKVTAPEGDALNVDAVLPGLPKRIVAPRVTGVGAVGATLTCEEGTYSGVPEPTLSVQWLREGEPIAGATSSTYTVQPADAGHQLQCKVTATNFVGWLWVKTGGIPIPEAGPLPTPPAPAPAPAVAVLPSITVVPVVTAASHVITSHHRTTVRLKCSGGPCKGTVQLLLRVVSHGHATTLVLASGSFSLQAGASSSVVMQLTAAGRSHLAHDAHRAVAAKLKVSLHGAATTTHAVSAT
jgi:hypothetical protein